MGQDYTSVTTGLTVYTQEADDIFGNLETDYICDTVTDR